MKFFGNGVIWDSEYARVLCKFSEGEFRTFDARVIQILKDKFPSEIEDEDLLQEIENEADEIENEVNELDCTCGFTAKNLAGLRAHKRKCGEA